MIIRRSYIKTFSVLFIFAYIFFSYSLRSTSLNLSLLYNFIIYVGVILYKLNLISSVFHVSSEDVKNADGSCISYMYVIVYSRSAYIYSYFSFFQRNKFLFPVSQGIIDFHNQTPFLSRFSCRDFLLYNLQHKQ